MTLDTAYDCLKPQARTFKAGLDFIDKNTAHDDWMLHIETFDPHEPFYTPDAPICWFERRDDDSPFYAIQPCRVSAVQWCFVMVAVATGFLLLIFLLRKFTTGFASFLPALVFCIVPLGALAYVAAPAWTALFRRLQMRDFGRITFGLSLVIAGSHAG